MKRQMGPITFIRSLFRILAGHPRIPASLEKNELLRVILQRRSIRRFAGEPIPDDVLDAILEAGRVAPSTVNLQSWTFAVFDDDGWLARFEHRIPFHGARAVIILADTYRARLALDVFPYSPLVDHTTAVMNASLAAMNMTIAAEAMGVSSVMLSETGRTGLLDVNYLKEKLGLPDGVIPIMTIVFGYARGGYPPMPPRLPLDQLVFTGTYKEPDLQVLRDWTDDMEAGYKAMRPGSSFAEQVDVYCSKLESAETGLQKMVF
jgi:nitroreductase